MPNALKGEVPIRLKGKEYLLRFTHDAIARLETTFNLQQQAGTASVLLLLGLPTLTTYRQLLLIGLGHKWTKLKAADVDPDEDEGLQEYFTRTGKAMRRAFNLAYTGKDVDPDAPDAGDGEGGTKDEAEGEGRMANGHDPDAARPTE